MRINTDTVYIGLIGNPLGHSLSPLMHNLTFKELDINCVYLPFEIDDDSLKGFAQAVKFMNFCGFNVTIPYKEKIICFLDDLSDEASACGAVNVVKNENGRLIGYNTDGRGFVAALEEEKVKNGGQALIIGAGGAARSIACSLVKIGINRIEILDIDFNKARNLADFIGRTANVQTSGQLMCPDNFIEAGRKSKLIVNCSPAGMHPYEDKSPVDNLGDLQPDTVLCDLIYNPMQTRFLSMGIEKGLKTINGLPMFINQGAFTLQILLGIKPPCDIMKEVLLNHLQK